MAVLTTSDYWWLAAVIGFVFTPLLGVAFICWRSD